MNADNRSTDDKSDRPRGGGGGRRPFFRRRKTCPFSGDKHQIDYKDIAVMGTSLSGVKSSRVGLLPCPPRSNANWQERLKGPVF